MIKLAGNVFNPEPFWTQPVSKLVYLPTAEDVALFDQNGYDLTQIEQHFAYGNYTKPKKHREHIRCLKEDWFIQDYKIEGAVLNHSNLFERKAYAGQALTQLKAWAHDLPLLNKVIALRSKWGLDFSMDYVDRQGNAFEILHWEWDSFDYIEIETIRLIVEPRLLAIDWLDASEHILKRKSEWHHLDFFAQSRWKCDYFGIPNERFKMVAWQ
jgi:hypothetical protein